MSGGTWLDDIRKFKEIKKKSRLREWWKLRIVQGTIKLPRPNWFKFCLRIW